MKYGIARRILWRTFFGFGFFGREVRRPELGSGTPYRST